VELSFDQGLVVFSGPSGAGKSVLISAILCAFGHSVGSAASVCEVTAHRPQKLQSDAFLLSDELSVKALKKEKLRYFIDGQRISRKVLSEIFSPYVKYLSVRDRSGFDSATLLQLIDQSLMVGDKHFRKLRKEYHKRFVNYRNKRSELERIREDEALLKEKMEFIRFEIEKIEAVAPEIGEEEELLKVKQQLSRIDKIKEALEKASAVFALESSVEEVYRLLEKDVSAFSEAMNQLRADFEESQILAEELEETDVEEVLDRLGELTALKNRYGSIEAALHYRDEKIRELEGYTHIEQDKRMLEQFLQIEEAELHTLASRLFQARKKEAGVLEERIASYLERLKLPKLYFCFQTSSLGEWGMEHLGIELDGLAPERLSGGEFNRVRLALMAATIPEDQCKNGVLILDEIDANVSGDESIAISHMIERLAEGYQVFAISHQPHLAARATQHIVVEKEEGVSRAAVLDEEGRIREIARIIAGERPTEQALAFARKLRS
jgi:DNA repair protein RecN (Recombination protein N)